LFEDLTPLAGFLFANAGGGYILVRAEDTLPRRRFTAAHELGHYLLHFLPRLREAEGADACLVKADELEQVREDEEGSGPEALSLPEMERQANRFAAELLMPVELCRSACARFTQRFTPTPRFLEHELASALLVSREAMRWRLRSLGLHRDAAVARAPAGSY
jgi:Zn-dependent peptidase ImmA (M78 family)